MIDVHGLYIKKLMDIDRKKFDELFIAFSSYLEIYRSCYPLHIGSYFRLKKFGQKIKELMLVPDEIQYKWLNENHEIFDAELALRFVHNANEYQFMIPFIVDITAMADKIQNDPFSIKHKLLTYNLIELMNSDNLEEFKMHNKEETYKIDEMRKAKENKPIIVMSQDFCTSTPFIINGNHRIVDSVCKSISTIEGFVVSPQYCSCFGITKDYEILYMLLLGLKGKVFGLVENEKILNSLFE